MSSTLAAIAFDPTIRGVFVVGLTQTPMNCLHSLIQKATAPPPTVDQINDFWNDFRMV